MRVTVHELLRIEADIAQRLGHKLEAEPINYPIYNICISVVDHVEEGCLWLICDAKSAISSPNSCHRHEETVEWKEHLDEFTDKATATLFDSITSEAHHDHT